jgi:hypothetical protein
MALITRTVTINAAFLREIKHDHRELWDMLRELNSHCDHRRAVAPARKKLAAALADLRDRLAMHFALEEAFGYFDDPLDVAPRLAHQADLLRSQHADLFLHISALAERGEALLYEDEPAARIRHLADDYRRFYQSLLAHEHAENRLIFEAFDDDIGVGD